MSDNLTNQMEKIKQVKQHYIFYYLLADTFLAAAIAVAAGIVLSFVTIHFIIWSAVLFGLAFSMLAVFHHRWQINDARITGFLDAAYPELEESAGLALLSVGEMNLLQRLQFSKVSGVLQNLPSGHRQFTKRLRTNGIYLLIAIVTALLTSRFNVQQLSNEYKPLTENHKLNSPPEKILPQIRELDIMVSPPAYTRLPKRKQDKFALEIPEGSTVMWHIRADIPLNSISLLFDGNEKIALKTNNGDKTLWTALTTIVKPGFYQVEVDGKLSDLYQVQVLRDLPPVIQIKNPAQYTYIDAGEKPRVTINTTITDDYGISEALIHATVAKGSGEAVKFKEQTISFSASFGGNMQRYDLQKVIDLPSLDIGPGDELYFYVEAMDNHKQLSRTDVYIVSIQDTAQLLSMDGIMSGANIKPEYFRSERQIILDAEKLLKLKDTISLNDFNNRSNDLGTDQKLLRLRYGKFLGEEAEGNIADPRLESDNKNPDPKDFGNGAKILDEYTDKHDNAEDAQFFDPTVKAQLKATLTEMWKAELQLRLYKPQDALPFAYKALRLLKYLQQKSRSYVAKTAYNPSPLKMDKRLSGDLTHIIQPTDHQEMQPAKDHFEALKKSMSILENFKNGISLNKDDYRILQSADEQLVLKAAEHPASFLNGVKALRHILSGGSKNMASDAAVVGRAIHKILPFEPVLPQSGISSPDMGLASGYFSQLKHGNR